MSESTQFTPGQFDGQEPYPQQIPHSGNLPEDMREVPVEFQQGPLQEHLVQVPGSSADIPPTPAENASESFVQRHKRALLAAGATVLAFIAGGVTAYEMNSGGGGGNVSAESIPTAPAKPAGSVPPKASVSSSPTKAALPAESTPAKPAGSTSEAPSNGSGGLTQEQLNAMQPLVAKYSESANTGSPEVIKTLYKDLQYADQTGRADFLAAAIGQDNMGSTLGTEYLGDISQFSTWFKQHPDQRLSFEYVPSDIKPDMSVSTPTYNLIVTQKTGDTVQKYAQTITLKTIEDTNGNVSWIIGSVDAAVPVN